MSDSSRHPYYKGIFLRIARAKQHTDEFEQKQNAYLARNPFAIFEEKAPSGWTEFKVRPIEEPPEDLATIVADALGAFRASLDNAVVAAARQAGATNLSKIYFPMAKTETDWDKYGIKRARYVPPHIKSLLRAWKPWKNGNELLYALSKLSVADKHQILTPIALKYDGVQGFTMKALEDNSEFFPELPGWNIQKKEALVGTCRAGRIELSNVRLKTFIGFGDVKTMAGEPIVPTLRNMTDLCEQVVGSIELAMR